MKSPRPTTHPPGDKVQENAQGQFWQQLSEQQRRRVLNLLVQMVMRQWTQEASEK